MNKDVRKKKDYIFTGSATLGATAGATNTIPLTIESGRIFMFIALMFRAITTTDKISLFSLKISKDSDKFCNDFIPCDAFGGNIFYDNSGTLSLKQQFAQGRPVKLEKRYAFPGGSMMNIELRNDYAIAQTIYVMLYGYNILL